MVNAGFFLVAALAQAKGLVRGNSPNSVSCAGASPFTGVPFTTGQECTHEGHLWRANWWTSAPPFIGDAAWKDLGACDVVETQPCPATEFSLAATYSQTTSVHYNGAAYSNRWWAQGVAPDADSSGNWQFLYKCEVGGALAPASKVSCDGVAQFTGGAYTTGQKCTLDGHLWEAKWWSNSAPFVGDAAWLDKGECDVVEVPACPSLEFQISATYSQATVVHYNGSAYSNQWWSQGVAPDADATGNWRRLYVCA